jgi:hypothetical protein
MTGAGGLARVRRLLGISSCLAAVHLLRCRVDETLDERLWRCETADECGHHDGRPMRCWQGYCMPSCDPTKPRDASLETCLNARVLVRSCRPSADDCRAGLSCFRTDPLLDEGVCLPITVCNENGDCPDTKKRVCAKTVLEERLGDAAKSLHLDHLTCVQIECSAGGSDCIPGERCLATSYTLENNGLPDICVPYCDPDNHCLPNYACSRTDDFPGPDPICIPGLPGVRCTRDIDCLFGTCVSTGGSISYCTVPCDVDEQCRVFGPGPPAYRCIESIPGQGGHCITPSSFQGVECLRGDPERGCPSDASLCSRFSPYLLKAAVDECRMPCPESGRCPARGGFPHVCLRDLSSDDDGDGDIDADDARAPDDTSCYPGLFSIPCELDSECVPPLKCLDVELDGRELRASDTKICSMRCEGNDDSSCVLAPDDPETWVRPTVAYCDGSVCRLGAVAGKPCERNAHCRTGPCVGGSCQ